MVTHTPADIKWLLNERAALAGAVAKASHKQAALLTKAEKLQRQRELVLLAITRSQVAQSRSQASLDALDATMAIVNNELNPRAAGTVNAWAGKYGPRGGLGSFIERLLEEAAPAPLTTSALIDLASRQFAIALVTPADRRSFRKSVSSALTSLHKRRLVEPLHDRRLGSHGLWRWGVALPTMAALLEDLALAAEAEVA